MNTTHNDCEQPDEKRWLKQNRQYTVLDESQLTSIFYFPLIWNIFEKECCGKHAYINQHPHEIAEKYATQCAEAVKQPWQHFHSRYFRYGQPTDAFRNFCFKSKDIKRDVKSILRHGNEASNQQKLEALLKIAFRLRHNLFHGEKDVNMLYGQNDNFRQANKLLMALIDAHMENR